MRSLHRAEQRTGPRCRQSDAFALKTPITSLSSARPDLMAMLVEITALHQPGAMDGIGKAKRDNGGKHDQAQPIFVPHDVLHAGGRNAGAANDGRTVMPIKRLAPARSVRLREYGAPFLVFLAADLAAREANLEHVERLLRARLVLVAVGLVDDKHHAHHGDHNGAGYEVRRKAFDDRVPHGGTSLFSSTDERRRGLDMDQPKRPPQK